MQHPDNRGSDRWIETQPGLANPTERDALKFFLELRSAHSIVLDFRSSDDKWPVVRGWLLNTAV
jgi:hypothetical protein